MIGYLEGQIKEKYPEQLLVNVRGVGYQLSVPNFVWQNCQKNEKKSFLVYTHVREDEISLYGFLKPADKEIFIKMIGVSGIGPRLSMSVLSFARGAGRIIRAIADAEVDYFVEVKGLGKKSAQRLIIDLKSQVGGLKELEFESQQDPDLLEALKSLGFSKDEIIKAIKGINQKLPLEEKIRQILKKVS
ncbi:Holliday junction branch migration protein RuvA [Patescibacteria group bacterium]